MTSFAIDPSKSKAMNVSNPYDFQGVSVSSSLTVVPQKSEKIHR